MATEKLTKICIFLAALTLTFGSLEALRPTLEPPSLLENKGALFSQTDEYIFADEYRLPLEVTPSYYVIRVAPQVYDTQAEDFLTATSNVVITVTAKYNNASTITLNVDSNFINITESGVQVRQKGGNALEIQSLVQDQPRTFFKIQLSANLSQGQEYEITIPYVVKLSDTTKGGGTTGIFGAAYTDPATNETRYMAATQFEPARARRAYPSFDEPDLKAQFEVHIGRKDPYNSLANMVLKETQPGENGWVWDIYNPTQLQSSYLVCFAVSDFVSVDAPAGLYGKPVKIWAAKYLIDQSGGVFAAQAAAKVLQYFNTTFGVDYKYPKMDSIAVPPFGGAMENWGLNVYGEGALLYIPGKSNENNKRSISNVIAHELAHQWFGNLVTCKWWSDIWLNEGFATFMSFQAENAVTPELEPLERFYLDVIPAAMGYDHGPSTHPVKPVVDNPVNGTKFTTMVYEKGAALIRMMDGTFGRDRFYKGLVEYLNEMSYKGAEQDDLFRNLQANVADILPTGLTVKDFMETWTLQTGYPVVRVSRIDGDTLYISQERYFSEPNQNSSELTTWNVPLSISTEQSPSTIITEWIRKDQLMRPLTEINANQWILVNTNGTGYYRVLYDDNLVKPLWDQLNKDHSVFSTTTRAMFLNDYFSLASAEYTNVENAFEFTRYLGKETKRVPWSIFLIHFAKFAQLAEDSPYAKSIILRYLGPRFDGLFTNIGLKQEENDNGHPVILRNAILERACPLRYSGCLSYGDEMYQQWKSSAVNPTPIDLRTVLYCGAVAGPSGSDAFDFFLEEYKRETDSNHKAQLINALPCSKLESEHQRLLELAEDPNSGLVSSHRVEILRRMTQEPAGRDLALAYIKANLNGTFVTPQVYADVISALSNYVYRDVHVIDIENHLKANEEILKDVTPSIQASLARIRDNGEWMHKLGNPAINWMGSNLD